MKLRKKLNPRGQLAKEMEIGLRRSIELSSLCELWLLYHGGDHRLARMDTPYQPPPNAGAFLGSGWNKEMSKAVGKAIKGTEIWERQGVVPKSKFRLLKSGPKVTPAPPHTPRWFSLLSWPLLYDHWSSGALEQGILDLLECLPKENRNRIKALLDG